MSTTRSGGMQTYFIHDPGYALATDGRHAWGRQR